jgi:ATP-dependent DNA ligase
MALPRVQPIRPTWRKQPFDAPDWLFEVKYDGFRGLCYVEQGRGRFISRNGNTLGRFDALGAGMRPKLPAKGCELMRAAA